LIVLDARRYGPKHKRSLKRRMRAWRVARIDQRLERAVKRTKTTTRKVNDSQPIDNQTDNSQSMQKTNQYD
jgi:hypothetical protein